jgi:15-cis-phytoene synthase
MTAGATVEDGSDLLRKGSSTFHAAARILDPKVRASVTLLYAWCRRLDDIVDGQALGHGGTGRTASLDTIAALRAATMAACRDAPRGDPLFEGLHRVVADHGIPEDEPLALIDGFAMDAAGRRYETIEDTLDYCHHVAGVVGLMMARILGVSSGSALASACDLGLAFQLTNIARDVVDDWGNGRVYLPAVWLADEDLSADDIGDPARRAAVHRVARRCVETAEPYYASARIGLGELPLRSAFAIGTALRVYRRIGIEVVRAGPQAWERRRIVGKRRKFALTSVAAFGALGASLKRPVPVPRPPTLWSKAV